MRFAGKTLLVSGAGNGIGAAIAELAAAEGANVACFDMNPSASDATAARIREAGGSAIATHGDSRVREDAERAVEATVAEFGGLSALAPIAGVLRVSPTSETPEQQWHDVVETNVRGPFLLTAAAIPHLRQNGGTVVMASSAMAFASTPGAALYSASKGAVLSMVKSLAVEYAAENIRVNCVAPGTVRTPMARGLVEARGVEDLDQALSEIGNTLPIGRIIEAEEIANVFLFLLSDDASAVTGSCFVADGGILASLN